MGGGLRSSKPVTVSWLRRELQIDELSQAEVGRVLSEREGCRNSGDKPCAASAPKILPRLAAQLQPEPLGAPRWPFRALVDWLKQMGFGEPDHSLRRCN